MSGAPSFTLFTYSSAIDPLEARWRDDGIGDAFFGNAETARAAIVELRDAVADEPGHDWPPMRLERMETVPVPAITVAIARFLRSSGVPRCAQFHPMAARRRSMVATEFGLAPRVAVPTALPGRRR